MEAGVPELLNLHPYEPYPFYFKEEEEATYDPEEDGKFYWGWGSPAVFFPVEPRGPEDVVDRVDPLGGQDDKH